MSGSGSQGSSRDLGALLRRRSTLGLLAARAHQLPNLKYEQQILPRTPDEALASSLAA